MPLCEYGCSEEAKYQFKNNRHCCQNHWLKCPNQRIKQEGSNNPFYRKKHTSESKLLVSKRNKGKIPWNLGIERTEEEKKKISETTKLGMKREDVKEKLRKKEKFLTGEKHHRWNGGYYNKSVPLYDTYSIQLYFGEEIRRNEKDSKILETKCTYCGIWFIPTVREVYERIRALNGKNYGEQRLYCSDLCKHSCTLYHQILYPKDHKPETSREVQAELRKIRFEVDNYTCQRCKIHKDNLIVPLHCHHLEGIRWEPIESADVDKVITLCETCHLEVHQKEGCKYNDMRCQPSTP